MIVNTDQSANTVGAPWRRMIRIDTVSESVSDVSRGVSAYLPDKLLYAEGDSWFDKFTPIPHTGTNLLDAIRTPFHAAVVDASHIGDTSADVIGGWQADRTRVLFKFFDFHAILLSAGGNDLKNQYAAAVGQMLSGGIARLDVQKSLHPANQASAFDKVVANIKAFIAMRDNAGSAVTRKAPVILNGYDYFQPRPARALLFAGSRLGAGPWVYPALHDAGLTGTQMKEIADAVVNTLNQALANAFGASDNVIVIDSRGVLTPAPAESTGEESDWLDEIHPSTAGFDKLAAARWSATVKRVLE